MLKSNAKIDKREREQKRPKKQSKSFFYLSLDFLQNCRKKMNEMRVEGRKKLNKKFTQEIQTFKIENPPFSILFPVELFLTIFSFLFRQN